MKLRDVISDKQSKLLAEFMDHLHANVEVGALFLYCLITRIEKLCEGWKNKLKPKANEEFLKLRQEQPGAARWQVGSLADVYAYSPRCSWQYPPDLAAEVAALDARLKKAQVDKIAKRIEPKQDPTRDTIFSVSLH